MTVLKTRASAKRVTMPYSTMIIALLICLTSCSRPQSVAQPVQVLVLNPKQAVEVSVNGKPDAMIECEVVCHGSTVVTAAGQGIWRVNVDAEGFSFERKSNKGTLTERMEFAELAQHMSGSPIQPMTLARTPPGSVTILFQHSFPTPEGIPPVTLTVFQRTDQSYYDNYSGMQKAVKRPLLSRIPIPRIDVTPKKKGSTAP
jgi:hypothetical protein